MNENVEGFGDRPAPVRLQPFFILPPISSDVDSIFSSRKTYFMNNT